LKSPRKGRGALNLLGVALAAGWKEWRRKKSPRRAGNRSKVFIPKGTDLSGGTPDRTCPVRTEFPGKDRVFNNSLDLLNI
jgi:hypothetical protein